MYTLYDHTRTHYNTYTETDTHAVNQPHMHAGTHRNTHILVQARDERDRDRDITKDCPQLILSLFVYSSLVCVLLGMFVSFSPFLSFYLRLSACICRPLFLSACRSFSFSISLSHLSLFVSSFSLCVCLSMFFPLLLHPVESTVFLLTFTQRNHSTTNSHLHIILSSNPTLPQSTIRSHSPPYSPSLLHHPRSITSRHPLFSQHISSAPTSTHPPSSRPPLLPWLSVEEAGKI